MQNSKFIISDSGTAQEEPALLSIPVIVPREFTERPESLEANNSALLGLSDESNYNRTLAWALDRAESSSSWLGDGNTSNKIVDILREKL